MSISLWTSEFTRKKVGRSLGGEVHAFSEMAGHMALLRELYAPFSDNSPGMIGKEDCESLLTHIK